MVPQIGVCQGGSCSSDGSAALLLDLEEFCGDSAKVCPSGCLGRCGSGPNVEVEQKRSSNISEGIRTFKMMERLVGDLDGAVVSSLQKQLGKLKWAARREEDAEVRAKLMAEAFEALEKGSTDDGLDAIAAPQLRAELLVMRSRQLVKSQPEAALSDARQACELRPSWGQARLALCGALEARGLFTDAFAELKKAQQLGGSVDKGSLNRQMVRLQRKAATEVKAAPPTAPKEPAAAPAARSKPSAKSAAAAQAAAVAPRPAGAATPAAAAAASEAPAAGGGVQPEGVPELLEWRIDSIVRLNHDCIEMRLHCQDHALLARQCAEHALTDTWHVDLLAEVGQVQEEVRRSYTPVSTGRDYLDGKLVLMLKVYPEGKMTSHLASLRPASTVLVSAPHPTIRVFSRGGSGPTVEADPFFSQGMLMIAGGSAVTVAIQVCAAVLRLFDQQSRPGPCVLVLCNHTAADALYRERLEEMLSSSPAFQVVHCLSRGGPSGGPGRATWRSGHVAWGAVGGLLGGGLPGAVLSGPRGLMRASVDMLLGHGWSRERVRVLDDLPAPAEEPGGEEALGARVPESGGVRRRAGPGEEEGQLVHFPSDGEKLQKVELQAGALLAGPSRAIWGALGSVFFCAPVCRRRCGGKGLEDGESDGECDATRLV